MYLIKMPFAAKILDGGYYTQGKTQQQIEGDDLAYMETIEVAKKVIESNLFD